MNEQHFLDVLGKIFLDEQPLDIHISIRDLWMIDTALSVVCRHPDVSLHQKNWMMHLHDQLIVPILERHPEAKELIEAGWDETKDVAPDPEQRARIDAQYKAMERKYLRKTGRI